MSDDNLGWLVMPQEGKFEDAKKLASSFNTVSVRTFETLKIMHLDTLPAELEKGLRAQGATIEREGMAYAL